jgi:thiosulfate reductase cytochrome b subunit
MVRLKMNKKTECIHFIILSIILLFTIIHILYMLVVFDPLPQVVRFLADHPPGGDC